MASRTANLLQWTERWGGNAQAHVIADCRRGRELTRAITGHPHSRDGPWTKSDRESPDGTSGLTAPQISGSGPPTGPASSGSRSPPVLAQCRHQAVEEIPARRPGRSIRRTVRAYRPDRITDRMLILAKRHRGQSYGVEAHYNGRDDPTQSAQLRPRPSRHPSQTLPGRSQRRTRARRPLNEYEGRVEARSRPGQFWNQTGCYDVPARAEHDEDNESDENTGPATDRSCGCRLP